MVGPMVLFACWATAPLAAAQGDAPVSPFAPPASPEEGDDTRGPRGREPPPTPSEVSGRDPRREPEAPPRYLPTVLVGFGLVGAPGQTVEDDDAWGPGMTLLVSVPLFFTPRRAPGFLTGWLAPAVGVGFAFGRGRPNARETVTNLLAGPFLGATYRARIPRATFESQHPLGLTFDVGWQPAYVRSAVGCGIGAECETVDGLTAIGLRLAPGASYGRFALGFDYSFATLRRGAGRFSERMSFHTFALFVGLHY